MTGCTHQIACECGNVKGKVLVERPFNHLVCYCRDCRAFARFLKRQGMLDEWGGSELVQIAVSRVKLNQGQAHLSAVRLTEKGMFRYYASCCNTPIGNLLPSRRMDFVGLAYSCLQEQDRLSRFGPVRGHFNTASAIGRDGPSESALIRTVLGLLGVFGRGWLTRSWRHSPFVGADGKFLGPVQVLSRPELEALKVDDTAF